MLSRYFGVAALALKCTHAFKDASPFFLFSSDQLETLQLQDAQVASFSSIEKNVQPLLEGCPAQTYIYVSQAGVSSADFAARQSTPHLERRLNGADERIKTAIKIANVAGEADSDLFAKTIHKECLQNAGGPSSSMVLDGTNDMHVPHLEQKAQFLTVHFSAPPAEKEARALALAKADIYLNDLLAQLDSYLVIYTTTPASAETYQEIQHPDPVYEMDSPFPAGMHGDLKRDLTGYSAVSNNTGNLHSNLPLFEKYQFMNQGIFITGSVSLLLFLILSVGISAIANLEVSYMAFSKEMGPAAQKKQQQ